MKTKLLASLVIGLLCSANAVADLSVGHTANDVAGVRPGNLFLNAFGSSYTVAPLVQDAGSAFFLDDGSGNGGTATFDGVEEILGLNTGNTGSVLTVNEAETDLGGGMFQIDVTVASFDQASGAPTIWLSADNVGAGFVAWRLDVGDVAAGEGPINWGGNAFTVEDSFFNLTDTAGNGLGGGNFALTVDSSDADGVSGLGVIGLGGADIAGFDVHSFTLSWVVSESQAIPEPSSLMIIGLASLGLAVRRRK